MKDLPVKPPIQPMLARLERELPGPGNMFYEPKWDGFRCIVFRSGDELELMSRNERPLDRYFPELVESLRTRLPSRCVIDGEIVIASEMGLDFDALLLRIHPAASRVDELAAATPASFIAFDILALGDRDVRNQPFSIRRQLLLDALAEAEPPLWVTPGTTDREIATDWFHRFEGAGLDGIVAKPLDGRYAPGKRDMIKVKHERTADCVVGGYRLHKDGRGVGSLLLGLYDQEGRLHHVGVASGLAAAMRRKFLAELEPLVDDNNRDHPWLIDTDTIRQPGGPSRWTGTRDLSWKPIRPERVAEVRFDHMQGNRFRHATRFVRWRDDRNPRSCTYEQVAMSLPDQLPDELAGVFAAQVSGP